MSNPDAVPKTPPSQTPAPVEVFSLPPPRYIDTEEALRRWLGNLGQVRRIAVDTEADSFHHYREKVCLIQISAAGEDVIIDPLAVRDLEPLRQVFADPHVTKIFHDAGYDLIGLSRDWGFQFVSLFDTMLASRLLGVHNFGLAPVLYERFGFVADKRMQRSDWAQRPLSDAQLAYARFDTHFLERLVDLLTAELSACGRLTWAFEDFARLPEVAARTAGQRTGPDPDGWWRIKGVKAESPAVRGRVAALYALRETLAERLDRPPFRIFGDALIIDLARQPPKSLSAFSPRRGIRRGGIDRYGAEIMKALRDAPPVKGRPPNKPARGRRRPGRFLDPQARRRFEDLRNVRRRLAKELGIDPEVALPNAVLEEIARLREVSAAALQSIPTLNGWRRPLFVPPFLRVLESPPSEE